MVAELTHAAVDRWRRRPNAIARLAAINSELRNSTFQIETNEAAVKESSDATSPQRKQSAPKSASKTLPRPPTSCCAPRTPLRVSRFIRALAFGMIVLGAAFAVLDWYGLLPQLPAATVAHDPSLNSGPESKGHG